MAIHSSFRKLLVQYDEIWNFSARPSTIFNDESPQFKPVRPTELKTLFGLTFVGLLLAAFSGILFLYRWSLEHDG